MLKYPCLVLDHDDTVVRSEATVNYPSFCAYLEQFRPGEFISRQDFTRWCFSPGFFVLCSEHYGMSEEEVAVEFQFWQTYSKKIIPPAAEGIGAVIRRQKEEGGLVCVVSHSSRDNIKRDYMTHFGLLPDRIYSWECPKEQRKPSPYPLLDIMDHYGLEPKDLLVVDDLKPGYDMAKAVGADFAFAGWERTNVPEIPEFMEKYCDFSFYKAKDLEKFLFED